MSNRILIDTCGWIDYFRSSEGSMGDFVEYAIQQDRAVLCGVVITELLQGARGKKEQEKLDFLFSNIEILATDDTCWVDAGITLQQLRAKGVTLPLTDALIATVATKHGVSILTMDKHFQHFPIDIVDYNKL